MKTLNENDLKNFLHLIFRDKQNIIKESINEAKKAIKKNDFFSARVWALITLEKDKENKVAKDIIDKCNDAVIKRIKKITDIKIFFNDREITQSLSRQFFKNNAEIIIEKPGEYYVTDKKDVPIWSQNISKEDYIREMEPAMRGAEFKSKQILHKLKEGKLTIEIIPGPKFGILRISIK